MDIRITQENLYKNVNENMFAFTFLCKFSCICNFAIFDRIFIKFSPKCRTKKLRMIYTNLGNFRSFFNLERADILPKIKNIAARVGYASLNGYGNDVFLTKNAKFNICTKQETIVLKAIIHK